MIGQRTTGEVALPRWARWLDAVTLACLLAGIGLGLAPGRVRLDLGFGMLSLGSAWRVLLLAVLIGGVRHWRLPRPHVGERAIDWSRGLATPDVVLSARMLLTTRLPILLVGLAATLIIGLPQPVQQISPDPVRNLPARWDATWYMEIARSGYQYDGQVGSDEQQSAAFFPLYPMLIRTLAAFTTPPRGPTMAYPEYIEMRLVHLAWCGLVISLLAFAGALVVLYRWAELHGGTDAAGGTIVLLSTYPFAVFYSAPYTEALFLLLVSGACYAFERGRLTVAGAAGLLAGLTRPNGVMLGVALLVLALARHRHERGGMHRTIAGVVTAAMPAMGLLLYCAFLYGLTGSPLAWIDAQAAWGREYDATARHYTLIWRTIADEGMLAYIRDRPDDVMEAAAVLFSFALVPAVWRRIGPAYAVFMLANLLPPLLQGGLLSTGRLTSTLFPQFLALALLVPAERRTSWIIGFSIAQGLVACVFFTWRSLY